MLAAATLAASLVTDGMRVGLGSGRAATAFIAAIGARARRGLKVSGVPTSEASARLARSLEIPLIDIDEETLLDLTVDGADEVSPNLDLVKGRGAAFVRERIVAAASRRQVIVVTPEKMVPVLCAKDGFPVEVIPLAAGLAIRRLKALGLSPVVRAADSAGGGPLISVNGNLIFDCGVSRPLAEPALARTLETAICRSPAWSTPASSSAPPSACWSATPTAASRSSAIGPAVSSPSNVVFLFDVDNTLLDNDRVSADLRRYLVKEVGAGRAEQYFEIFEALRMELGYSDYLGALQRYRVVHPRDPHLLAVSSFLVNYPFANRLFPGSLDALEHAAKFGQTVILTDGDVVFQPGKIERAGLSDAVDKRVLIYIHEEHELDDVERRYPADHYVLVDDKIPHSHRGEKGLGRAADHGLPAPGTLRPGP